MRCLHLVALSLCLVTQMAMALSGIRSEAGQVATLCVEQGSMSHHSATVASDDTYFDRQWAIRTIMAPQAWQLTSGDASVVIAVLDTGIAKGHEDLAGRVIAEVNFSDSPTTYDIYGHGTHIAGIISAAANNGRGVAGLAYDCRLMNVKVADEGGACDGAAVAEAIMWAVEHSAKVINMSLFMTEPSSDLEKAVDYAWSNGVVVVAAAGNRIGTALPYPAYYSNCIAVAATDASDSVVPWSGQGDWVDVAAPGVSIYSTLPFNEYDYRSGTSMAAAYVSGVAGLLLTVVSDDSGNGFVNDEVRVAIENSCDELGIEGVGKGRINAFEAVSRLSGSKQR